MGARARATLLALALSIASLTARAQTPPHDTFTLTTTAPAETRHLNVYKPPGYDTSTDRYPVLYMPDGGLQEDFPHVAKALDEGIRAGEIQPLILVGIENTERRRDMTGPTTVASDKAIAPRVGGSSVFRAFIAKQLIPEIGRRYRVNAHRGIIGESLAGLFSVESFLREPDLFDTVIAISPSLWWNDGSLVREAPALLKNQPQGERHLFLTSADEDNIAPNVAKLADVLKADAPKGLDWIDVPRPEQHHDTIYLASEKFALRRAYSPKKPAVAVAAPAGGHRVLFIGNSLTYVNNLPSAFGSLASASVHVGVDMIARAGASLEDYDHDPVVMHALATGGYTDVILQERGGNATCTPGCEKRMAAFELTDRATVALANDARAAGARVYYLGTWQRASREISEGEVRGERRIAALAGIPLIELSETRRLLMETYPDAAWTHADGEHPGQAMTALMALRTWRAVMGEVPTRTPCVAGALWYHAPNPEGVLHIDMEATPSTCLIDAPMAARLSAAP
ncbi:alpha/beta hydrolase-fold protein [Luteibacter sp. dw_328]|uniref:alpha/beta hydrolase n=1 Tax=Luteibacter sp. dw_328 TaxID=2719796 RepID=UPI001BD1D9E1|nr:alpha/beta hydrolase-fold protein [Luteibacter sp. dw_328]